MARAEPLCGVPAGVDLAAHLSGDWTLTVVHARAYAGRMQLRAPFSEPERVTLALSETAPKGITGTLTVKSVPLAAHLHPTGAFAIEASKDHYDGFSHSVPHMSDAERGALTGCDIRTLPQISAQIVTPQAENAIELVAMGPNLLLGAQVTTLKDPQTPEMRIISALVLRRPTSGDFE